MSTAAVVVQRLPGSRGNAGSSSSPIVQLAGLGHRYADRQALSDLNLEIPAGCVFGLLGPNGGGKTTLFKILATLLAPSEGRALISGADVVTRRREVRERIGIVFQMPSLDVYLTVAENLKHQGSLYGLGGAELRNRSAELLDRFGIADRADDRVNKLSGGLQRRVELAKSLLHRPDVLILDEPSTGLDPGARLALTDYLVQLRDRDGVTSLLTTHLMDEADRCDHVAVIDRGKLVAHGPPSELKATIGGDVVAIHGADATSLSLRISARFDVRCDIVEGVIRIERPRGHEFVPDLIEAFPGEIESVTVGKPTLDDVFQRLTGHGLWDAPDPAVPKGGRSHG